MNAVSGTGTAFQLFQALSTLTTMQIKTAAVLIGATDKLAARCHRPLDRVYVLKVDAAV